MRRQPRLALLVAAICCGACEEGAFGSNDRSESALARSAPCDKWAALAGDVGCALPSACAIEQRCADVARAFFDCVAADLAQCLCESGNGDLNCEGAYRPEEGPARCTAEHRRMEACLKGGTAQGRKSRRESVAKVRE